MEMQKITQWGPEMNAEQTPCHFDPPTLLLKKHVISLLLSRGYRMDFHPSYSAQVAKQLYQSSSEM